MSGIAPPGAPLKVDQKIRRGRNRPGIVTALLAKIALAMTAASAQTTLPAGLESPDGGVVCNHEHAVCYDRNGASSGLTETFLGHIASERLTTSLRNSGTDNQGGAIFCRPTVSSVCREPGRVDLSNDTGTIEFVRPALQAKPGPRMPEPNKENPKCDLELRYRRCFSKYLLSLSDDCMQAIRPEHLTDGPWRCFDVARNWPILAPKPMD